MSHAAEVVFRDDFNDASIAAGWTIIREDRATYSLTTRPGFFQIQTVRGNLGDSANARNILVRPISGDFILDTRLNFDPRDGQPFGGLIVYQDDHHAVTIGLVYASGARGEFRGPIMFNVGDGIDPTVSPPAARYDETNTTEPSVIYLRLLRRGDQFVGAYSQDGTSYRDLGTVFNALDKDVQVGVGAANGDSPSCGPACDVSIPADFDYFQITALDDAVIPDPDADAVLESVEISGPADVIGGASASFTARAIFSDGSSQDVTSVAQWQIAPTAVGAISGGVLSAETVVAARPATVVATFAQQSSTGSSTKSGALVVRIVPELTPGRSLRVCGSGLGCVFPFMILVPLVGRRRR